MVLKTSPSFSDLKVGLENIESYTGRFIDSDTEFDGNGIAFTHNDILYGKLRPYLRKVWLAEFEGNAVGDFFVFGNRYNSNPIFIKYLLLSDGFTKQADGSTFGAKMPRVASDFILTLPYYLPPLPEQEAIATWLDEKCGEIDAAIAKVDREIELIDELKQSEISRVVTRGLNTDVPLKQSGIDWIGEIPSHWETHRIKNVCNIFGRIGFRGYTNEDLVLEGEGAITLSPSNIIDGKIDYSKCSYLSWEKYYESPEIMIEDGDVIFVKTASVGKSALINNLPLEATLNPQLVVFKNLKINNRLLAYILKTPLIAAQVQLSVGGSTILTITQNSIENYIMPLPPLTEQQSIADYLDRKCAEIDGLKEKLVKKRETLKELRQSIISEVVTGKRKVI